MSKQLYINKVAVLGSGVMGAQIAAHFANALIEVKLFDLKANANEPNQIIKKSLTNLQKINPNPCGSSQTLSYITPLNYDDNLDELKDCDLIIEAIVERLDLKEDLYKKVSPYINKNAIFTSNTSGLSIESLKTAIPLEMYDRFCGVHFFNPPRYMPLVEIIPSSTTRPEIIVGLEEFLVSILGKSVIIAKDTPNFIANRIGTFAMIVATHYADKYNIPFEVVDELTGKKLGRAKSATFRTVDIVGLDTYAHVVETLNKNCQADGFESSYTIPAWLHKLISNGRLGTKTKAGIYTKDKDGIKVIDPETQEYRAADKKADKSVITILKNKNWANKLQELKKLDNVESKFLLACFCNLFHYAALMLGEIADYPNDIDLSLRLGFGWTEGIFEIWQEMGWKDVTNWIEEEIENGKTISDMPLPKWVFNLTDGIYLTNKSYCVKENVFKERNRLPIYQKQLFPDLVLNEYPTIKQEVLFENDGVVLWHSGDYIGILSFKSKMCTIGSEVLEGINSAIDIAESKCIAMVIWQKDEIFSAGANLEEFGLSIRKEGVNGIDKIITMGHNIIAKKIRYSKIPVIAAVKGYAFGGGCELMLHCDAVVAAFESYIGLVEAGVGLIPGWGGVAEMAYRAANTLSSWQDLEKRYKNLAMAIVSSSARNALELGFLKPSDTIVMNSHELLYVAREKAKFMASANYRPPVRQKFKVFGSQGIANIKGLLANMIALEQISEHDYLIASSLAHIMCGGEIEEGTLVTQEWLLNLELEQFKILATNPKSQARIEHMLTHGKPLRN